MYYNQSFDEMPEDILLHGKLKNDGRISLIKCRYGNSLTSYMIRV